MLKKTLTYICLLFSIFLKAQESNIEAVDWLGTLHRPDGNNIVFNFQVEKSKTYTIYILNASERIKVENVHVKGDSIIIQMPVFESELRAVMKEDKWIGNWTKGGSSTNQVMPFTAIKEKNRFPLSFGKSDYQIKGRWAVSFANDKSAMFPSVAEFEQEGNNLTGTFLTPTGDYRYLQGVVTGNQIRLSTFDGGHAFLFTATIDNKKKITNGKFFSGLTYEEDWLAKKKKKAKVNSKAVAMSMKPGEERLNFSFPDLDGNKVSIHDQRFKNKVVIVQLMGSWCPNCMDETAFLSEYYNKNKERGVEVISLAYEYSTDYERSVKSLKKFQQLFDVQYPMLITGVSVSDSLRTEKTLPQISPIKFFPSSIIIDRKGIVRKFDTEFVGPGTAKYFEEYSMMFFKTIDDLLNEK